MGASLDAMMRANTKRAMAEADIVLNVPVKSYSSLAWRKSDALIEEGYKAAEAIKEQLLPHALADADWQAWVSRRAAARKTTLAPPAFVVLEGVKSGDQRRMSEVFNAHVGRPLDVTALEHELNELSGLDRYETIRWQLTTNPSGETGLTIRATEKQNAPPFLMLGLNLENTTSDQFQLSLAGRYLRFDVLGSGSELRLDASAGADPSVGAALYYPVWRNLFVVPAAGIANRTYNFVQDDAVVARYGETLSGGGVDVGLNLGRDSDVRVGAFIGRDSADVIVGDPGLPAASGRETKTHATWRMNTQDRVVQPTRGVAARASFTYTIDGPDITTPASSGPPRSSVDLPQLSGEADVFKTIGVKNTFFLLGGGGTSFAHHPLAIDQFLLGRPLHLGAYGVGEVRGDHYWIATVGVSREIGRMPDFLGGPVHVGVWLENGDAFDSWNALSWRTQVSTGLIVDTLIGPMLLGASAGFDGRWRTYVGIGRLVR
jgi:NTE family protein